MSEIQSDRSDQLGLAELLREEASLLNLARYYENQALRVRIAIEESLRLMECPTPLPGVVVPARIRFASPVSIPKLFEEFVGTLNGEPVRARAFTEFATERGVPVLTAREQGRKLFVGAAASGRLVRMSKGSYLRAHGKSGVAEDLPAAVQNR